MAVFCIPKYIAAKLKQAAANGEINIKKLYEMDSKSRNEFWQQYVTPELAQFINAGFEKAVLDQQQKSLENWVKATFSIKDKAKKKDVIDRIGELSQSGALNPVSEENFLSDLVAEKLGVSVSAEEAQEIDRRSTELKKAFEMELDQFGLPSVEYFKKRDEMNKYLQSLIPSSKLKITTSTIGRGTMLFSIKSPIVNIIGNTIQQLENRMEKRISSKSYAGKVDKSLMKDYIKKANYIYQQSNFDITRLNSYADGRKILGEDVVHSQGKGFTRKIGRFYEDFVFKQLMSAPDVYFSSITFADSANLGATKLAKEEGLRGEEMVKRANEIFKDATSIVPKTIQGEYLRETAIADSLVATFQNDTDYSSLALGIRKLFNTVSGNLRIGDQIMPFVKTPANVVGMTLDAGGLGAIKGFYNLPKAIKQMKEGNPEAMRGVARDFTRAGLGLVIAFVISAVIDPEDFIGRYPTSQSEQELLTTKKARENSIKIGNKWVSLDYFGFLGGALVGFLYSKKYGKDFMSKLYSYGSGLLLQSANIPGFEQIKDLTTEISRLKPEEGEGINDTYKKFKASAIDFIRARIIPAFVNDIAKATDISEREVDSKKPGEKVKAGIPGLRQTLKEKTDIFGAVIKGEPWWSVMLFGSRIQTARENKVIDEVTRLSDKGFTPTMSRPEKSANSRMAQLKTQIGDDKYYEANKYFREKYLKEVSRLIDSGRYKRMSDEDKKNEIDKIRQDAIDLTLKKYHYKKPKKTSTQLESKKTGFNFNLVKEAYAAEINSDLKNKLLWTKDDRTGFEKFLGKVQKLIPFKQGLENPIEGITAEKLSSDQKREYYNTMLALREQDIDWYYKNIGNKVEMRILGQDLGKEDVVRKIMQEKVKGVSTTVEKPTTTPTKEPIVEPTIEPTKPASKKTLVTPTPVGEVQHRNPKATPAITANSGNAAIVIKYADKYGVPRDLATDIAFAESSLDNKKRAEDHGFDGKTINPKTGKPYPYSSASGLFMFTNGTWDEMKNRKVIPKDATYEDKLDPELNAKAAMWAISHGMLSRWNASKGNWGVNYSEEELKKYY